MIVNMTIGLFGFALFVLLQSLFINSLYRVMKYECTEDIKKGTICNGLLLYPIAKWMDEHVSQEWIKKPLYKCVQCMASVWGGITFWGTALMFIGFDWREVPIYVADVFLLVTLNYIIYKQL